MRRVIEDLSENEHAILELSNYELQGMENAVDQFLRRDDLDYSERHVKILFDKYTEKYIRRAASVRAILKKRGINVDNVLSWSYERDAGFTIELK